MKKLLVLTLAALMTLTACHAPDTPPLPEEPGPQQELPVPEDIPFQLAVYPEYSLHPVLAENRANLALAPLLYEPLFALNAAFEAESVLCESWTVSGDGLVWTLTLKPNIVFSDGTPLTGDIVAAALNTARIGPSRFVSRLSGVTAVTGEGLTVTITLNAPNGNLPVLLDIPIALDDSPQPLGTGAYVLSGAGEELSLNANPRRPDLPRPVDTIPLKAVHKSDELILSFESGDVALVDVDLMGTNSLGYSGSYETWDYATTSMLYLGFNTQSGACRSPEVRQALAMGIDRESIAQVDFAHHAVPAALPVHPNSPLYHAQTARTLSYDPEGLMDRLAQLHLSGRTLRLLVNSENAARVHAAERIAQQLNWTGLELQVEKLAFEDYALALEKGDFDLYLAEVPLTADFDLSALLLPGAQLNYGGWSDPDVSALLTQFRSSQGTLRAIHAKALYAHLAQEVPIAPICFKNGSVLTRWGRLSGLEPVRGNVFYHLEGWNIA